jgi:hypothetical protein
MPRSPIAPDMINSGVHDHGDWTIASRERMRASSAAHQLVEFSYFLTDFCPTRDWAWVRLPAANRCKTPKVLAILPGRRSNWPSIGGIPVNITVCLGC